MIMAQHEARRGASRDKKAEEQRPRFDISLWFNRLLILSGAAVVGAVGLKGWNYISTQPIEHIRVTGDLENLQRESVQELIQPALTGGFLKADLDLVRHQLESLPWIYEASVRRRWPASLQINVVEQRPIARWGKKGFINHSGEVFQSRRADEELALPALRGPDGSARELMSQYLRLKPLLRPLGLELRALELDSRGQLRATTTSGMELVLGNSEFVERIQRFAAIYPQHLQQRLEDIERVDLRYDNGMAVAFSAPENEAEASQLAGL